MTRLPALAVTHAVPSFGLLDEPRPRWAGDVDARTRLFLIAVGLAMAISALVLFEPAPVDLLICLLIPIGFIFNLYRIDKVHAIPVLFLLLFALFNVISLWNSVDPMRGVWYIAVTLYLLASTAFFFAVTTALGKAAVESIFAGYTAAAIVTVVLAAGSYLHLIGGQQYLLLYGRPKGLFKDPNVFGPFVVPVAVYAAANLLMPEHHRRRWWIWGSVLLVCVPGIFLSFSRACWMNLTISMAGMALFQLIENRDIRQIVRKLVMFAGLCAMAAAAVYLIAKIPVVDAMLQIRLGHRGLQTYDRMRFHTHSLAMRSVVDEPLGIGPGQSEFVFRYATHSTYLRAFSENGVLGGISLLGLFAITVFRSIGAAIRARDPFWRRFFIVVSVCTVGQLANCVVIDSLHWRHFWFLFGLAWTAREDA